MRVLILTLLLTGCAGKWQHYDYGPAQWLEEKGICNCPVPYTTPKKPKEWKA